MSSFIRRFVTLLLLLAVLCQPLFAFAEEDFIAEDADELADLADDPDALAAQVDESQAQDEVEKYIALATKALKVRRGPGLEYFGSDSIPLGSQVHIIELGTEWAKVRTSRTVGYVLTKYLENIREYDPLKQTVGTVAKTPAEVVDYTLGSTSEFKRGYVAYAVKHAIIRDAPDEQARAIGDVPTYKEVLVSHVDGDWSYARYEGRTGYILNASLFKWDRIDPYAGPIPGNIVYPTIAFLKHTTNILDYDSKKKKIPVLKTIGPGSAICVEKPDDQGRYKTPYWRKTGYVTQDDIAYTMDVVPYDKAEAGDLISVMTTYYAVGIHTLNYQGRNWNIYLSTSMISNSILQPNAVFNVNKCIGPYRISTGYKRAPIASPTALWGYGGGTCQVNTTLYNTIIQLPIFVNHRQVHANVGAKYFLKGFDAAVGGGDVNMIFTNTLPYPIRFNFFMSDGVLTCCIFRAG